MISVDGLILYVITLKKAGKIKCGISVVTLDYFFSSSKLSRDFALTLVDCWRLLWVVVSCCEFFCGNCFGSFGIVVGFTWIVVVVLGCCGDFLDRCGSWWTVVDFFVFWPLWEIVDCCGSYWIVTGFSLL